MSERIGRLRLLLLGAPITVLSLAATVSADTIYVCWDGSGDYLTIQEGIDAASDGDEVLVCDGTYTGGGNKNIDFRGKAIAVRSENGPENCTIDCQNTGRGFYFHSAEPSDAVLDGFTVTRGSVEGYGGGIYCESGDLTIINCIVQGNAAVDRGAGIFCGAGAEPTIKSCVLRNNSGGGLGCEDSSPTVIDCRIVDN